MNPKTLFEEDFADAKERLLAAAEEIFADYGYEGASIRQICTKAGMNVASVNYHFGDKEHLYIEAVKRAHVCASRGMVIAEMPPDAPPVRQLELFIRGMVTNMHAPASPASLKLVMREMADPGKAAGVIVDEFVRPFAFRLRSILRELFPDMPEPRLLMFGFSVIGQCLFYRQNRPVMELIFGGEAMSGLTPDMVADHVVRFTLAAVAAAGG